MMNKLLAALGRSSGVIPCLVFVLGLAAVSGCTVPEKSAVARVSVELPVLKNSPNECYFLDEFMPTPNRMVTGQSDGVALRYYHYEDAKYKVWQGQDIILGFYSKDSRCWSLYEEMPYFD